jgi:hypothetical protein
VADRAVRAICVPFIERARHLTERLGLGPTAARLLDVVARARSRAERERHRALVEDLRVQGPLLHRLATEAPTGDRARLALFVASFATPFGRKLEGVLSLAARLAGRSAAVVELDDTPWGPRYHRLFRLPSVRYRAFRSRTTTPSLEPRFREFLGDRPTVPELLRLTYRGVDVGRIALSNWLNENKFVRFDLGSPAVRAALALGLVRSQAHVLAAERLLDRVRPSELLLLEKGLSPAAELVGAALHRGIPVVQYAGSQVTGAYVLKRFAFEGRHQHPFSLSPKSWERARALRWDAAREDELMSDFVSGYRSGSWFDRKFLHRDKHMKPADDVRRQLGLDPRRKTAVVFSHVLWDATFFYGEGLFDDYETWLIETLRAAAANDRLNWVVKLHPDLVWKLRYEGHQGELRDLGTLRGAVGGRLPDHVKLVMPETDISTYSFFAVTDYCLTVRGTVGIEMACHGVPVITAGTGRYSGLGFTVDSTSQAEYRARLARLQDEPPMSRAQTELARRFAYVLFKRRPWVMNTFEMRKRPLEDLGHPLDTDLVPRISSFSELARSPDTQRLVDWLVGTDADYLEALD